MLPSMLLLLLPIMMFNSAVLIMALLGAPDRQSSLCTITQEPNCRALNQAAAVPHLLKCIQSTGQTRAWLLLAAAGAIVSQPSLRLSCPQLSAVYTARQEPAQQFMGCQLPY